MKLSALVVCATVSLALVATTAPAQAEPTPPTDRTTQAAAPAVPKPRITDTDNESAAKKAAIRWAKRIERYAVYRSAVTGQNRLNYSKANTYDQGKVVSRRKFAAGFQLAGGYVTNISRSEQKKVNEYKPSWASIYKKLPKDGLGRPYCKGSNRYVEKKAITTGGCTGIAARLR